MGARRRITSLGIVLGAFAPALAGAQGRITRPGPTGPIAVTLPSPPPGSVRGNMDGGYRPGRVDHRGGARFPDHRLGGGWRIPLIVTSPYEPSPPVPVAYPVPYYYPVPVPAPAVSPRSEPAKPALPPYNPANSKTLIIGAGADGGGGVMRIARPSSDSLRITWLGTTRPIRQATLFVADDARRQVKTRVIDLDHREAHFSLASLDRPATYAGLTVVFADGSTQTTLVPLPSQR